VGLRRTSGKTGLLKNVQLFQGLSERQLQQIARLADEMDVPTGKVLARAGETGHEMFVIVEGQASVTTSQSRTLQLGAGDFFGEMSLLDGGPRSATVEAATPMRLLVIGQRESSRCWPRPRSSPRASCERSPSVCARLTPRSRRALDY